MSRDNDFLFWNVNSGVSKEKENSEMIRYRGAKLSPISILICCFVALTNCVEKRPITVSTRHGAVKGFSIPSHYSAYHNRRINVFLGIPYAKRLEQYRDWRREFRFNVS